MPKDAPTLYNQPNTVAVLLSPDGDQFPCNQLLGGLFWAAGMVAVSPDALADRLHEQWHRPSHDDSTYERQERAAAERAEGCW